MTKVRTRGEEIRRFILENLRSDAGTIVKLASDRFGISRQAVNKHIRRLVAEGAVSPNGKTRSRTYSLAPLVEWTKRYPIDSQLAEDVAWRTDISMTLGPLPENVLDIWNHGFTEMFNNARDHSGGSVITVQLLRTAVNAEMLIVDDGVGIFRKIQNEMGLLDERHAILELAKGKLTTDPKHHSGEGIFFTSRMFESFNILSGGVYFSHQFDTPEDWILEQQDPQQGTAVWMKLSNHTARTTKKVFDRFSSGDDYGFTKTVVPVRLAQYGNDKLISRSQAKRVVARVELFKTVLFDFKEVPTIGQAFADEIFRVFALEHPEIQIFPINANSEVRRMIRRVKSESVSP